MSAWRGGSLAIEDPMDRPANINRADVVPSFVSFVSFVVKDTSVAKDTPVVNDTPTQGRGPGGAFP
jgi:hypothetical protein